MAATIVRIASICLFGCLAAAVALKVSVAGVFAESRPATALAWTPDNALAQSSMATRLLAADLVPDGRRLALLSMARSPVNIAALRNLATAAGAVGEHASEARLFSLANRMSRRDRSTQIWLIRQAFQNGDYDGAIHSFDIAMRTSARATEYLAPIVVAATADRRTLPPLATALARNPDWRTDLLRALVYAGPNLEHVALLIRGRLDPSAPADREALQTFLNRLVQQERFDLAWIVYQSAVPGRGSAVAALRNGDFEQSGGFVPFDWSLTDEGDLLAVRGARPDGRPGAALSLVARNNRAGPLARQLIRLAPGRYRIVFEAGSIPASPADRPRLTLGCATGGQVLGELRPAAAGETAQRVVGSIVIPQACRWQWLTISLNSGDASGDIDPWIDNLAIQTLPATG